MQSFCVVCRTIHCVQIWSGVSQCVGQMLSVYFHFTDDDITMETETHSKNGEAFLSIKISLPQTLLIILFVSAKELEPSRIFRGSSFTFRTMIFMRWYPILSYLINATNCRCRSITGEKTSKNYTTNTESSLTVPVYCLNWGQPVQECNRKTVSCVQYVLAGF